VLVLGAVHEIEVVEIPPPAAFRAQRGEAEPVESARGWRLGLFLGEVDVDPSS
jgi:hypothetical protein